jgi:hypothetical protein
VCEKSNFSIEKEKIFSFSVIIKGEIFFHKEVSPQGPTSVREEPFGQRK